ncbi:MAG: general secretion pathway protein GspB [Pseudomonadota bacterium]
MSYLLEALRKSERERQENRTVPGLQTPTVEWEGRDDGRSRSPWLVVAVVAICLNTVLLALLVWRFGFAESESVAVSPPVTTTNAPAPTTTHPAGQTTMPAVIVVQQPREPAPAVVVRERAPEEQLNRSAAADRPGEGNRATPPATRTTTATVSGSRDGGAAEPAPVGDAGDTASDAPPPNVNALPLEIRQQLPLLTMNSHIYASNARDSFVMINGVSLNPGDEVSAGLRLIAVVPEGAVLAFNGQRFLLPALASFSP